MKISFPGRVKTILISKMKRKNVQFLSLFPMPQNNARHVSCTPLLFSRFAAWSHKIDLKMLLNGKIYRR